MSTDTLGANATVSPADQRALLLWDRRREKRQAWEQLGSSSAGTEEACEAAFDRIIDVEHVLEDDMRDGSIHALGAVLLTEIEDNEDLEACAGLYRAACALFARSSLARSLRLPIACWRRSRMRGHERRRQKDDAPGPLDPRAGASLAGPHAAPDCAPAGLGRQNAAAVTAAYDDEREAAAALFAMRFLVAR